MSSNNPALWDQDEFEPTAYDPRERMRKRMRWAFIAMAVLLFGFGLAGAGIPIGGAVVGSGQVGVESRIKRIAHPTGGIIAEIRVENGQYVRKGQILMRLDDTVSGTSAELSTLSVVQLLAQRARLEAEQLGAGSVTFPKELLSSKDPGARKAMANEGSLFRIRRAEQAGQVAQLNARVSQYVKQIGGFQAQISALQQQQALIEPERKGVRELWDKDLVTINRLNQLERTSVDMTGNIAALQANIAQTQARITEAREQALQLREARRSEAGTQLTQINGMLNEQQVRSVSAEDQQDRSLIRAPYSGIVDKLAFATIGDVVKPAETIMEIVPATDKLIVESAISPADVDQVRVGQRARIRFSAFNMATTPEFSGEVVVVAPERTINAEAHSSYYQVRIAIDEADLKAKGGLALKPGMPAETYIETGSRSMLSYLTKPLRDQLARAFRDN